MKIILVSQNMAYSQERDEYLDSLDQRLVEFVISAGYIPISLSNYYGNNDQKLNLLQKVESIISCIKPSGIVLSGGNNIGEFSLRDNYETTLLSYAEKYQLPVLGICRGMQFLAHHKGVGTHKVENHTSIEHPITGEINKLVNSFHNFSINECPSHYKIIASSMDDEIEAIRNDYLNWEGWMWHPERNCPFCEDDIIRFRSIFG
jgi:putative glutamine amidotransferase